MAALAHDPRLDQLKVWVSGLAPAWSIDTASCVPASADASFRRYFRLRCDNPAYPTVIVMDAPPAHEDCRPFVHVAGLFGAAGVHVPQILAQDLAQGFLLLSDLGGTTYLSQLDAANARQLYGDASEALIRIQSATQPGTLPAYDRATLQRELDLFPEWYIGRHLGITLTAPQQADLRQTMDAILANNLAQPQVYVHRDYHSRNLMVLPDGANPGVLDFQDALIGPITYDAVSLWRDAYIEWDEEEQLDWLIRYWERARKAGLPVSADFGEFYRDFEWMGLQRHLKVLGIFARLYHRDGKDGYLADLPLVMKYTRAVAGRYTELKKLIRLLDALEGKAGEAGYTF